MIYMIDSAVVSQVYLGDGVTTQFPIPFPFSDADDVKCSIYDIPTETETDLTDDYYVDTVAGKVIYPGYPPGEEPPVSEQPPVLPDTQKLVVYRETPINQLEDLGEKYPLPIVEDMVDKNTMILQEMNEITSRAVVVERGSGYTPKDVSADIRHLKEYRDDAMTAAANAAASQSAAYTSETNAAASASAASVSETNAAASETNAASSASAALASKNAAALSASNALTSEQHAAASESNAASSETAASVSAAQASTSASTATAAAGTVSTLYPQILTAATNAGVASTAAQAAATSAQASAATATTKEQLATAAATNAAASETAAAASALAAANSAGAAATSATEAAAANTEAKYYAKITMDKVAEAAVGFPSQEGTLTYDGTEQEPEWDIFFEQQKLTVSGTLAATNAGTYSVTMTPKPTYYWWDTGTTETRTQTWTIGRAAIEDIPSQASALVYDGTVKTPTWDDYDPTELTLGGTTSATEAGTYTATFTPTSNYQWADTTITAKSVTWEISSATVAVPTVTNTSKTYNGSAQSPTISTYDPLLIEVTGDTQTDAGSYNVVFHLKSASLTWTDTTTADKTAAWSISPKTVTIPTVTGTTYTYDGTAQGPTISSYDPNEIALSGNATATNVGTYSIILSLTSITNYVWSDTTTAPKSTTWSIIPATVAVPSLTTSSFTYNGAAQSPTISAYDSTLISATGDLSATNAGSYTITFSLINPNVTWLDSTTTDKTASWSIAKAAGSLSISPTTISLNTSQLTDTITVTRTGDGAISAVSSDTSIATVSLSGTTITVTAVANGSATVTVSVAAGTNWLAPTDATASVAVSLVDNVLNNNSWATISAVAQAGTGDTYWDVGDVKMIELNGKVGDDLTLSNISLGVYILDFNHAMNGTAESNIIFGGFKTALTSGYDVALDGSGYGIAYSDGSKVFNYNHTSQDHKPTNPGYYGTNYGGWKGTDFRYDILGATSTQPSEYNQLKTTSNVGYDATAATLTSPKADTFLAALPSDLRGVLRLWTRWVDAVGNKSNVDANIIATVDAITLLAESEVFDLSQRSAMANIYEQNHNTQMSYYANGNSRQKRAYYNSNVNPISWGTCSPGKGSNYEFCSVGRQQAGTGLHQANVSTGLAPAFKV